MPEAAVTLNVLSQSEARQRVNRVRAVEYDLTLSLQQGAKTYDGEVSVRFQLDDPQDGVFLDCTSQTIHSVALNGVEVSWRRDRNRLYLESGLAIDNIATIRYTNEYDHIGAGLHQFVDPEDGEEYLYTHFEPYDAHRLTPCFDQPDIKAILRLTVTAPSAWEVAANYPVVSSEAADAGRTRHVFSATPRISTYLFAFIAGPYQRFTDTWSYRGGETQLGVLCRGSIAPHFDPDEFFEVTRNGLTFFSDFFDFAYPFDKYDQIFVPEFNMGAMENVGCITFSERMIFRDTPTEVQRLNRAMVVLHEMAHMWFGDLVTMQWWNDLWLNESFATYMSYVALDEATRWSDSAWVAFHSREKAWAYEQDALPTTHPIAGEVPDTDATFLNFDGITYGKGAAVLKQLVAFIGPDGFRAGMQDYFQTHAWGNTTLEDFLAALERGSGRELGRWSELWLETAGTNTIAPQWDIAEGAVNSFVIAQSAPTEHPTLRPHRTQIAVYDDGADGPNLRDALPVDLDGAASVIEALSGAAAPSAVFPNHEDHAFAKIALDARTLSYVQAQLDRFPDGFQRLLLWHTLWDMVRDQQFSAADYASLAIEKLAHEDTLEIAQVVAYHALQAISAYLPDELRIPNAARLYAFTREQLFERDDGDFRIMLARVMISSAQQPAHIAEVLKLIDDGTEIDGFELDQDMRWSLITKGVAYGVEGAFARLDGELERDPSDRGRRAAEQVKTSRADLAIKEAEWARYRDDSAASLQMLTASMHGFWWKPQAELLASYVDRFFDEIVSLYAARDKEYASRYFGAMNPARMEPSPHVIERSQSLLDSLGEDHMVLARQLRESIDEARRAQACRAYAVRQVTT